MNLVPHTIYITSGYGEADDTLDLLAFDRALANAKVADYNHLRVSSIIPPKAILVFDEQPPLRPGSLAFTVMARTNGVEGEEISACLGFFQPNVYNKNGVIFEVSDKIPEHEARRQVLLMGEQAMQDRHISSQAPIIVSKTATVPPRMTGCVVVIATMIL